ncbi:MAG: hypothetical protein JOZ16_05150, partial [Methylobacteriaceae bacterium]|nr:hypothetical protein [Methylobacteriaceae bacterium]
MPPLPFRGDLSLSLVAERLQLVGMLGRRSLRRAFGMAVDPLRPLTHMRAKAPQRLAIAPQDIRTVDPTIATEIYS